MSKEKNIVKAQVSGIRIDLDAGYVTREVLRNLENMHPEIFTQNPGFIAQALITGYDSPTVRRAQETLEINSHKVWNRVRQAVTYMGKVGIGLNNEGKSNGFFLNSLLAAFKPSDLTKEQKAIWGGEGKDLLIQPAAVVEYFRSTNKVTFEFPVDLAHYVGSRTASEVLREQAAGSGTPDGNMLSALYAMSMEGRLDEETCKQVVSTLRQENAPTNELPQPVLTATSFWNERQQQTINA